MDYKDKADLTLRCMLSEPLYVAVLKEQYVDIQPSGIHTDISIQLGQNCLSVTSIDVKIGDKVRRFFVDSITSLDTQYTFHCLLIMTDDLDPPEGH